MAPAGLLADVELNADLAWLVERVTQSQLPWVVVSRTAVARWTVRDPIGWSKFEQWLDAQGVTLVPI